MGAPGTMVEGAEKPVMRAVVVRVKREMVDVTRVLRRMLVVVVLIGCRCWSSL